MLYIRQSNKLERLADHLIDEHILAVKSRAGLLAQQQVVVQNQAVATWLNYRLAEKAGVAATMEFALPARLVWRLVVLLAEGVTENVYAKQDMRWHLFALLDSSNQALWQEPACAVLAHFLRNDQGGLKRLRLASWIADLFDQYLLYRPQWMLAWRGKNPRLPDPQLDAASQHQAWQPLLWRTLTERCADAPDRAMLQETAHQRLAQDLGVKALITELLGPKIYVFGLLALPPVQLQLLLALAKHIDVCFYIFNPCQEYWLDIVSPKYLARLTATELTHADSERQPVHPYYETSHTLLGAFGRAGRDFIDLLLEFGDAAQLAEDFEPAADDSLLHRLQNDILTLQPKVALEHKRVLEMADNSLCFVGCYGAMREVEALHDWLLESFAENPALLPKDIIVMVPDINSYTTYIKAVFSAAQDELHIPYAICDYNQTGTLVQSVLEKLLRLPDSRLTAADLLEILEIPAVMRAFNLENADIDRAEHMIQSSGIRWGKDTEHWQQFGFKMPPDAKVLPYTWDFGLQRMMAGYCMGEEAEAFQGLLPLAGMSLDSSQTFDGLLDFIERILYYQDRLAEQHTGKVWAGILRQMTADFLAPDSAEQKSLGAWYQAIAELELLETALGINAPVGVDVILEAFQPQWHGEHSSHQFLSGKVTFCTLLPMRNIPFSVVALLGINPNDFPRRSPVVSFSLLESYPRKGDRRHDAEELYALLEAILAARTKLYLSWNERNPQDNAVLLPASVISQIRDVIDAGFAVAGQPEASASEHLIRHHPLQPFSNKYNPENARLQTYSKLWAHPTKPKAAAASPGTDRSQIPKPAELMLPPYTAETRLSVEELAWCFADPAGYLLKRRFNIWPPRATRSPENIEPFSINALPLHQLKTDALQQLRDGLDMQPWAAKMVLLGQVPLGSAGEELLQSIRYIMQSHQKHLTGLLQAAPVSVSVDIACGATNVQGTITHCVDYQQVHRLLLRAGTAKAPDLMRLWINHLALAASGSGQHSLLVDDEKGHLLLPVDATKAQELLLQMLSIRLEYLHKITPLTVASAWAWARAQGPSPTTNMQDAAKAAWYSDAWHRGENSDWETATIWPEFPGENADFQNDFARLAKSVWSPLATSLQSGVGRKLLKKLEAMMAEQQQGE